MDSTTGGLSLSARSQVKSEEDLNDEQTSTLKHSANSLDLQRATAASLARDKVLAAYQSSNPKNNPNNTRKLEFQSSTSDWKKYHSAWQDYYQKYYSEYYADAARKYVESEKLKTTRLITDEAKALQDIKIDTPAGALIASGPDPDEIAFNQAATTLRTRIQSSAIDRAKRSRHRRHLIPIFTGLSVVLILLFLQYNRLIFAPIIAYVAPASNGNTISPIDPTVTTNPGPEPKLLIPKLNVDVPVVFNISNKNSVVMEAMNRGVAQFRIPGASAMPGEIGNLVITGHSAGDIYSSNPYKFIFSGLERLENGDLIHVNYNSKRYTYSVSKKVTVEPTDIKSLTYETPDPVLTLITCTPLGTSRFRLLVTAKQIHPATTSSTPSQNPDISSGDNKTTPDSALPANEPSFFENVWKFLTGGA